MLIKFANDRNLREIAALAVGDTICKPGNPWSSGFISHIGTCPAPYVSVPFPSFPLSSL